MKAVIDRIRAEFLEMPGLRLTVRQVQRLFGVDHATCQEVLDVLVGIKFLRMNADGTYMRMWDGQMPHLSTAKAELQPQRRRRVQKTATG